MSAEGAIAYNPFQCPLSPKPRGSPHAQMQKQPHLQYLSLTQIFAASWRPLQSQDSGGMNMWCGWMVDWD
jgi:hypothetical protein